MFFRKSPLYVWPLQWEEFNSILVFSKVYMLKSSCLGKGPWLNLPTSHSFNAFWLTFTVHFTLASHACVQTYRHTIILCQSPNPNKVCSKPWCTCLLYLPVKSCSSSHRAQPSSRPVTALSVVFFASSLSAVFSFSMWGQHTWSLHTGACFSNRLPYGESFWSTYRILWDSSWWQTLQETELHFTFFFLPNCTFRNIFRHFNSYISQLTI